eukprot:5276102-Amphidinium_carterae.1
MHFVPNHCPEVQFQFKVVKTLRNYHLDPFVAASWSRCALLVAWFFLLQLRVYLGLAEQDIREGLHCLLNDVASCTIERQRLTFQLSYITFPTALELSLIHISEPTRPRLI